MKQFNNTYSFSLNYNPSVLGADKLWDCLIDRNTNNDYDGV